ncbi:MAG TPA: SurA N-terminal domain-containing protein [Thermoanaerobaculia bacterium]|nr:SurA N-terminal domain-containing protein [Thermoanaerobaculia bacterium]
MLKVLRDNLKYLSWILWVVILVFIAFVFVDFGGGLGQQRNATSAAATVGDRVVSYKDFERQYRQLEQQYRDAFGERFTPELADQLRLPAVALERLVNQELLLAEARRQGLRATDEEVQRRILEIPAFRGAGGAFAGTETYQGFLRRIGYTAREFEEEIRDEILVGKLTGLLEAGVAVPDEAVELAWRERNEKATVRYLLAPASRYAGRAAPAPGELEAWFAEHRDEFRLPDRRVVDYLLVDAARLRATLEISDEELRRAYEQDPEQYRLPEQVHARHILVKIDESRSAEEAEARMAEVRSKLAAGADFAELAAEYSDDPGSRDRGGDVGWFERGRMVPEFEQAAFDADAGSVVGPVRTSFGLHLIDVVEKRAGGVQPFDGVAGAIRARLASDRAEAAAETRARDLVARLRAGDPADEAAWQALADEDVVTFTTTPPFGREEGVPGIGRNPEFADAAFALAAGEASEPVRIPRGWAVLRLREEQPAHEAELAEVEAPARAAFERERSVELARAELAEARAAIEGGESFDAAAARLGLEVAESPEFGRTGSIPGLGPAAPLAATALTLEPGQLGGPVAAGSGAVLFEVVARTRFEPERFAAEREGLRDELRRDEANRLLAALLAERRTELGVSFDPPLLERYGLLGGGSAQG